MDGSFWREIASAVVATSNKWTAEQGRSDSILAAFAEFHSRLRLLSTDEIYDESLGAFAHFADALPRLRAKHLNGMDNLTRALRASVDKFKILQDELAHTHERAWKRHASCAAQLPPEAASEPVASIVGAGRGRAAQPVLMPPVFECLNWLGELDAMFSDALFQKVQLLERIGCGIEPESLTKLQLLWRLQPDLRPAALDTWRAFATSLQLAPEDRGAA